MILSANELASLWHPPTNAHGDRVSRVLARWLPPAASAFIDPSNPREITMGYGERTDGTWAPIGMDYADLRFVLWMTAPMGRGKSEWLKHLFTELMRAGAGFMGLDCKAKDLVNTTIPLIPLEREKDVVILDLGGTTLTGEHLFASMNMLTPQFARSIGVQPSVLASIMLNIFSTLDPRFETAPGMRQFATFGILALAEAEPRATLLHLIRFYSDEDYRTEVCQKLTNAQVKDFWLRRFPLMGQQETSSLSSFERRLDQLLTFPELAALMVAPGCSIDLRRLMDSGGILLAGIAATEGPIASLAATLLLTQMSLAALSRTNVPESQRPDWPVIIDEAQIVFEKGAGMGPLMFSQLRGMRIGTCAIHQNRDQIAPILSVLAGNAQNVMMLGSEMIDAATFASEYSAMGLTKEDFVNMERFQHMRLRMYGRGPMLSARMPPMVRPLNEPAPPPVYVDWRTVRAPARNAQDQQLDDAIARFRALATFTFDDAVARLAQIDDGLLDAYCARTRAHREAQRRFILDNPGCIPVDPDLAPDAAARAQKETRIRTLSALGTGVPRLETQALQYKLLAAAQAAAEVRAVREAEAKAAKRGAKPGTAAVRVDAAAARPDDAIPVTEQAVVGPPPAPTGDPALRPLSALTDEWRRNRLAQHPDDPGM